MLGIKQLQFALCSVLTLVSPLCAEEKPAQLGVNLSAVMDWATEWSFTDVFRTARPWIYRYKNGAKPGGKETQQLDKEGWPLYLHYNQWVETLVCRDLDGHYPGGRYVCLYEGKGLLRFYFDARVIESEPGRVLLYVSPSSDGILMQISETNPDTPIHHIRLFHEEYETTLSKQPFHPLFLERLKPFQVLRFMDWQRINNNPTVHWEDRAQPSDYTQATEKGVALEFIIELCNTLDKDPWLCIPHQASDDYVRAFAHLLKDKLHPERHMYLEYSNEVWNSMFQQANYAKEQGVAASLSKDPFEAQLRFYSQRSVEVFKIFEDVFASHKRFTRVLASQAANPWVSEKILEWNEAHEWVDALALAPYFGSHLGHPDELISVLDGPIDRVFERCREDIHSMATLVKKHKALSERFKLSLIAYEGGQHLVGHLGAENNPRLTDRFIRCNRDPRMGELYRYAYKSWRDAGGELFTFYHSVSRPSKWGSWGLLEYQDQSPSSSPKYEAVTTLRSSDGTVSSRLLNQ